MSDILFEERIHNGNKLGKIILNRPAALNALNDAMLTAMEAQLLAWEKTPEIKAVIIRSNNPKAFCAGGDIRDVYENHAEIDYFHEEYRINRLIFHYSKPYIAFMNGITMGGGVGVSLHARYRVTSTDLRFAMPETTIGFFPDVGVTYHFSRLPHHIGTYLALTGNAIGALDAFHLNLIEAIIQPDQFDVLEDALMHVLAMPEKIGDVIARFHHVPPGKALAMLCAADDFAYSTVEEIFHALKERESEFAKAVLSQLQGRSPTSLKVVLRQMQLAKEKTFDQVIAMDCRIAAEMLKQHDFFEGIRAAIIDKDKNPKWVPAKLEEVSDADIDRYFKI